MNEKLNDIDAKNTEIRMDSNTIEGQLSFFSNLLVEMDEHPDVASLMVKHGVVQKKLDSIYQLINYKIQDIINAQIEIDHLINDEVQEEGCSEYTIANLNLASPERNKKGN